MSGTADLRAGEQRALRVSIAGGALLGLIAVVWGLLAGSRVLLFDGLYAVLGIVLSGISLLAAAAAESAPTPTFPFGKKAAVPLAIGVQGAVLLGTLLYAAGDAIVVIRAGGAEVSPGVVLAYGIASTVLSLVLAWWLALLSGSELVAAERAQWRASALLSAVIAVGGAVALWLDGTRWGEAVAYADPVLVLIACALIVPVPLRLIRSAGLELLEAVPPPAVRDAVHRAVGATREQFGLPEPYVAATKLGGRLYLDVTFVVEGAWTVADEDGIRHSIIDQLAPLGYEVWANVELTTDVDLAE